MTEPKAVRRLPIVDHVPYTKRSKVINPKKIPEDEWEAASKEYPESEVFWRPKTRADCANIERPCPYVSCAHNTFLDVTEVGHIQFNYPDMEPGDERIQISCVLDAAETHPDGLSPDEIGIVLNTTRQRAVQIEQRALAKLWRNAATAKKVRDLLGE